jgi:hypothetical protein
MPRGIKKQAKKRDKGSPYSLHPGNFFKKIKIEESPASHKD